MVAEGVSGIDVVDVERVTEVLVEMDRYFDEYGHALGETLASLNLEVSADEAVAFAPDAPVGTRHRTVGFRIFLDECQVAVAVAVLMHFAQFGF